MVYTYFGTDRQERIKKKRSNNINNEYDMMNKKNSNVIFVALIVIVLQTGSLTGTDAYAFQKTTTTTSALSSSSSTSQGRGGFAGFSTRTSTLLASAVEKETDAFSSFADSLELSSSLSDDDKTTSNNAAAATITKPKDDDRSWQSKLDELLDPSTNLADRQILLSELLTSNDKIRDSVLDALTNRKLDPVLTPTQKKLQEGTRAVVRQLANDILPQITERASSRRTPVSIIPAPADIESIGTRIFSVVTKQIQQNFEDFQEDLTDPINKIPARLEKQRDEVLQEAKNVFLEKPLGLEEPPFTTLKSSDLYEIRQYDAYTVASTRSTSAGGINNDDNDSSSVDDGDDDNDEENVKSDSNSMNVNVFDDGLAAGNAFNTLASYIFGANDESKAMSMTTPVTTTSAGDMRFYISPTSIEDGRIPLPQQPDDTTTIGSSTAASTDTSTIATTTVDEIKSKVEIVQIPSTILAVRKFTGFVTDGEVARQKDTLLQALEMDGIELDVAHGAIVPHVIFEYNPPYTLPMVRCNEIGLPVRDRTIMVDGNNTDADSSTPTSATSLKKEWTVEDDDTDDDETV